jgi:hypothetical protein
VGKPGVIRLHFLMNLLWSASFWSVAYLLCLYPSHATKYLAPVNFDDLDMATLARFAARNGQLQRIRGIANGEEGDISDYGLEVLSAALMGAIETGQKDIIDYIDEFAQLFRGSLYEDVIYQASVGDNAVVLYYLHDHKVVPFGNEALAAFFNYGGGNVAEFIQATCIYYPKNKYKLLWKACDSDNVRMVSYLASQGYDLDHLSNYAILACFRREYLDFQLKSPHVFAFLIEATPNLSKQDLLDAFRLMKGHIGGAGNRLDNELLWRLFHKLGWEAYLFIKSRPEPNRSDSHFLRPVLELSISFDCWKSWEMVEKELDAFVEVNMTDLLELEHGPTIETIIGSMLESFNDPSLSIWFKSLYPSLPGQQVYWIVRALTTSGVTNNHIRVLLGIPVVSFTSKPFVFKPNADPKAELMEEPEPRKKMKDSESFKAKSKKWLGKTVLRRDQ